MKLNSLRHITTNLVRLLLAMVVATLATSCDKLIYDDLDPCPQGLRLRFIYDYNMERANAFPAQVHCLTLLVYDAEGRYVTERTVTDRELLSDENWRLDIDLPGGTYQLVAYGGMACPQSSFGWQPLPGPETPMSALEVFMKPQSISTNLHPLFYGPLNGNLTVTVPDPSTGYTEATVEMMKDTNNLRVVLQQLDGTPVNDKDFSFRVEADNTLFDYKNNIIPTQNTIFEPWTSGQAESGVLVIGTQVEPTPMKVAYAEFGLSRIMVNNSPSLVIDLADGSRNVVDIPLVTFMSLYKSEAEKDMGLQEYLDRESRWTLFFFLDKGNYWIDTRIVVNDWVVRLNDIVVW